MFTKFRGRNNQLTKHLYKVEALVRIWQSLSWSECYQTQRLIINKLFKEVAILAWIREAYGSNLGKETNIVIEVFRGQATATSFQMLSTSSFTHIFF
jgi:hypothetical protein